DDVPVLEHLGFVRDAVADDVVGGDAGGLGVPLVAEVGRGRLLDVDDVVVADAVELVGADAGLHVRRDDLQHLGRQAAGHAHLLDLVGGLEGDGHASIIAERGALCPGGRVQRRTAGPRPRGPAGDGPPAAGSRECRRPATRRASAPWQPALPSGARGFAWSLLSGYDSAAVPGRPASQPPTPGAASSLTQANTHPLQTPVPGCPGPEGRDLATEAAGRP